MESDKKNKPKNSDFKQQRLKGWQCIPSREAGAVIYMVLGLVFLTVGVIITTKSNSVVEVTQRYDDKCSKNQTDCTVRIHIPQKMNSPVFLYYIIEKMYQNHREYSDSRSVDQLLGHEVDRDTIKSHCKPIETVGDLNIDYDKSLPSSTPANPCGLIARSHFNDTFNLVSDEGNYVIIDENGISWDNDKFIKPKDEDDAWTDVTDEHFIVWMSVGGLPKLKKLWGKIKQDLDEGHYKIHVNNTYDVSNFDGKKYVHLTTTWGLGGNIGFLGIIYILVGCFSILGSGLMAFSAYYRKKKGLFLVNDKDN